ncbi:Phosphoglycerate kinase [Bienertia sinuspersici]
MGLWWRDVSIEIRSYSAHHFAVDVLDHENNPSWRAFGIYGWPEAMNKYKTWELMSSLKANCSTPYIMFGDFNEILSNNEKEGGAVRSERCIDAFRSVVDECELQDLGYKGSCFTWQRRRTAETMIRDRFLAKKRWLALFPNYEVRHFPIYKSDHAPIMLIVDRRKEEKWRGKLFKFEALWLSKDECRSIIEAAWNAQEGVGAHIKLANCSNEWQGGQRIHLAISRTK